MMLPQHASRSPNATFLPGARRRPVVPVRRQRGVVVIIFALLIVFIIGLMGLALDMSRLYNRKVELQAVADVAALAAARKLGGTATSIDDASAAAASAVSKLRLNYSHDPIPWSSSAIKFGSSAAAGAWLDSGAAKAAPGGLAFVQVDTGALAGDPGMIETLFMRVISPALAQTSTSAIAIAGRSTTNVTPLAICAMSTDPAPPTASGELIQYGFRRGVAYDLMQLNPGGKSPMNFVINPIDLAGGAAAASNTAPDIVGPFACSGTLPAAAMMGTEVLVTKPFPVGDLFEHLNSRFDQYNGGACKFRAAPPDANIRPYVYNSANSWMEQVPAQQTAAITSEPNILRTVAELKPPSSVAPSAYGPMWSFARPVPRSAYVPGVPEPLTGYLPFAKTDWPGLFIGAPKPASNYPGASVPYAASGGSNFTAPAFAHGRGVAQRRVLNVPLLACPVGPGPNAKATVLAVGRFFMTVPATASTISAEFGGIASDLNLGGAVELYK